MIPVKLVAAGLGAAAGGALAYVQALASPESIGSIAEHGLLGGGFATILTYVILRKDHAALRRHVTTSNDNLAGAIKRVDERCERTDQLLDRMDRSLSGVEIGLATLNGRQQERDRLLAAGRGTRTEDRG